MSGWLHFEIEQGGIDAIIAELSATPRQVKLAIGRALARTATTLRTRAAKGLKTELELRTLSLLRKRLRSIKMRVSNGDGIKLWFGLNTIPVSWYKGKPHEVSGGAEARGVKFSGAFVAKSRFKNRQTIFKRDGKARLHIEEQQLPVADKARILIEDKIFVQTEKIFWQHFERDLRARVNYKLGKL